MSELLSKLDKSAGTALINAVSLLISDKPSFLRGGVKREKGVEVGDIFPRGKLPFSPTSLETPEFNRAFARAKKGKETTINISPASVHNRQLSKIPGGAQNFVNQLRSNYERDMKKLPYRIDWAARSTSQEVTVNNGSEAYASISTSTGKPVKILVGTESMRAENMSSTDIEYHGLTSEISPEGAERFAGRRSTPRSYSARIAAHELGHAWTSDPRPHVMREENLHTINSLIEMAKVIAADEPRALAVTYHSALQAEYVQGALAGYNILRDVTGKRFDEPQMIHKALDEMVANPKILDQLPAEPSRIFRSYLHLREHNPKLGESLRRALARDCQYLGDAGTTIREVESQSAPEINNPERIKENYPTRDRANRMVSRKLEMPKIEKTGALAKNGLPRPRHLAGRNDEMSPRMTRDGVV